MSNASLAYRILADEINADAARCGTRFGDRKVFLSTIPGIDLADPECIAQLKELRRLGLVQFARADLVGAMDPALVRASEWVERFGTMEMTTHFIVLPDHLVGYPSAT